MLRRKKGGMLWPRCAGWNLLAFFVGLILHDAFVDASAGFVPAAHLVLFLVRIWLDG